MDMGRTSSEKMSLCGCPVLSDLVEQLIGGESISIQSLHSPSNLALHGPSGAGCQGGLGGDGGGGVGGG